MCPKVSYVGKTVILLIRYLGNADAKIVLPDMKLFGSAIVSEFISLFDVNLCDVRVHGAQTIDIFFSTSINSLHERNNYPRLARSDACKFLHDERNRNNEFSQVSEILRWSKLSR